MIRITRLIMGQNCTWTRTTWSKHIWEPPKHHPLDMPGKVAHVTAAIPEYRCIFQWMHRVRSSSSSTASRSTIMDNSWIGSFIVTPLIVVNSIYNYSLVEDAIRFWSHWVAIDNVLRYLHIYDLFTLKFYMSNLRYLFLMPMSLECFVGVCTQ